MAVEYDLIIIGSSSAGIYAAATAARKKARVALVTMGESYGTSETIYHHSFGVHLQQKDISSVQWAKAVIGNLEKDYSPAILAALGVDILSGVGEFCRLPRLGFIVNERRLHSRSYLLALNSTPVIPFIDGLSEAGYLTPLDIWTQENLENLPKRCLILGNNPIAVELAQNLGQLGREVILVTKQDTLLPAEDSEASFLIQAKLEAEGIQILTQSPVTQIKTLQGSKWIQAGNQAIETDEIIIAGKQKPSLENLNLEGVGIDISSSQLSLNPKLQTSHPRIYGCGDIARGYSFPSVAQYEAQIALKNALFLPIYKVNYHLIPWVTFTSPSLARVGLTEAEARQCYGKDIFIVRQPYKHLTQAQIFGEITGFCKLIVRKNGTIIGAHIVGAQAGEIIGEIALAVSQKLKLNAIAKIPHAFPTFSEILFQTATEWEFQQFSHQKTLQNLWTMWLKLRRSWSK